MKKYLKLLRVKHYIKNLLIFVPLLFSELMFNLEYIKRTFIAFIIFSLTSSVVYIINDIFDIEEDKLHEKKKTEPIASGQISINKASIIAMVLFILAILLNLVFLQNMGNIVYILLYLFINILYTIKFKHIPIVDIVFLASGFLIRLLYGASTNGIIISNWLYLNVISAAFALVLGKRRNEINMQGVKSRKVLQHYTKDFLDKNMYMFLAITIVFYSLWCVDPITVLRTNSYIIWTIPLVIIILMKYCLNIEKKNYGNPVDILYEDKVLITLIILYITSIIALIYL